MHFPHFPRKSLNGELVRFPRQVRELFLGLTVLALMSISFLSVAGAAQDDPAAKTDDTSPKTRVEEGKKVFHDRCLACHNKAAGDTTPFGPPNLHGIFKGQSAITTAEATTIIVKGKNSMPAWGNVLSKSEISSVIAYLKTQ
jgi:mono/diheme cytochrome c family protein